MKNAKIEPLIIEKEKLQELKSFLMRNISGSCSICGKLPSHRAIYRKYGVIIIEKYCDQCLVKQEH